MSQEVLRKLGVNGTLVDYLRSMRDYLDSNQLKEDYLSVDHVAWKAENATAYEEALEIAKKSASLIVETQIGGRRISIVQLKNPITLGPLGTVEFLEVMEPKPNKPVVPGLDHFELLAKDFDGLAKRLALYGGAEVVDNGHHKTIPLKIDVNGRELKFTDRSIKSVIDKQVAEGISRVIYRI